MATPPEHRRGRWRRFGGRVLIALVGLALVVAAVVLLGLKTAAGRRTVLARVANVVENRAGVRLTARDFRVDLTGGALEVEGLALAVSGPGDATPFLTVRRARAVARWRSLFAGRSRIESLSLENPRLDLRAPIPSSGVETKASHPAPPALEILRIDVAGGEVLGPPAPEKMDVWLDTWRAVGIKLRGEYRSGRAGVERGSARWIVGSHRRPAAELDVHASISLDLGRGLLTVETLEVRGDGLTGEARGEVAFARGAGLPMVDLVVELDVDLGPVFPDLTSGGRARAAGELRIGGSPDPVLGSVLRVDAADIPGELLSPWLDTIAVPGPLDPSGTRIDLDADLDLAIALGSSDGSDPGDRLVGDADLSWRRGSEPLLEASVRSRTPRDGTGADGGGVHVSFDAALTPTAPGRRRVSGELHAPGWTDVLGGRLRSARIEVDEPDLAAAVQRVGFDPAMLPAWWPEGGLAFSLEADGPVTAPRLRLDARWNHGVETLATISARTMEAGGPAANGSTPSLRLSCNASLLPEAPGRRELSGELHLPGWHRITEGELRDGLLMVELNDLGEAERDLTRRLPGLLPPGLVTAGLPDGLLGGQWSARVAASGPVTAPDLRVDARWAPADDELLRLVAAGRASPRFPFMEAGGTAELSVESLGLSRFGTADPAGAADPVSIAGTIDATLKLESLAGGLAGSLRLDGEALGYGEIVSVDRVRVEATSDGRVVDVVDLSGRLLVGGLERPFGGAFSASGSLDLSWPLTRAELRLSIDRPFGGIDGIETLLRLEAGTLRIEPATASFAGKVASMRATIPLGALASIVEGLAAFSATPADGPISVALSDLDVPTVMHLFDRESSVPALHGALDASLTFDPADPVASEGWLALSGGGVDLQGETIGVGRTLRIEIANARIVLPRTRLQPTGGVIRGQVPLELSAVAELAPEWAPGDDLTALVRGLSLDLDGTVDASLLNPFLAGGAAIGEVDVTVAARGSMDDLTAEVRIRGPGASVFYRRPFPMRLEGLEVDLTTRGREVWINSARARVNEGDAELTGSFTPDDGLDVVLHLAGVHYRLDFGIATRVRGDVRIEWPIAGRKRLSGPVVVERAVLRRPIKLDREMLRSLFDVRPEAGAGHALDTIDLDLSLGTDEGTLVKNNLANLHADWDRLQITGTAAAPLLEGRADVRPGGIVTVFGVAYRIDEASFEWSGEPPAEPRWILEWTSSLDDPTIIQSWRNEWSTPADLGPGRGGTLDLWGGGPAGSGAGAGDAVGWQMVATGVATQATSAHRTQLSYEPLPLFGETDTQARYTLAQDLSPQVTFIASTNPREAEAQTYILDVHRVSLFPSLRAQIFTSDQKNAGLTIQQTLKLGARPEFEGLERLLKSKTIEAPEGIRKRSLRRAIGFRKADPFPEGAGLDVEVDVSDAIRRKGYPSAGVTVDVEPTDRNRVDVVVTVVPGTHVGFVFEGTALPSAVRRSIASAYRPLELGEPAALEEVQIATVRALHAQGHLDPRVDVESAPVEATNPGGARRVRVIADGGRRVGLSQLAVEGLPEEDARRVEEIFSSKLSRVQLVIESPATEATLVRVLQERGYPAARIAERILSDDGETLVVRIEQGEPRTLVSIEIQGLAEPDVARLAEALEVRTGDPVRADRIRIDARAIERDLRDRGHAEARVRARTRPIAEDRPLEVALVYDVDPGASYRIEEVRFEGLRASRKKWVEGVAGLEPGAVFRQRDVAEARGRLYRTGVFRQIRVSSETEDDQGIDARSADAVVKFELQEQRPWRLAYGGRWEDDRGISGVVDLLNQNSLGRGHLSGLRAIYGRDDQSLRFYHVVPRVVGERSSLELFLEGKRERVSSSVELESAELWAQLTFPLSRRAHNRPYIRFQNPRFTFEGAPDDSLDQRVISPLLGWQMAFDALSRRAGEQRRRGVFFGVDFLGSHEGLGSDVSALGTTAQVKYFLPIGRSESGRFTWAQFWRGGWSEARDEPVPLVDRFRAGGEFSVRGYPTNSLGPLGPDNIPLGGEMMFIVNQELHAELYRKESFGAISALLFFDAGNVWLNRDTLDSDLFKSVGVGIRYLSPVGPFRLDYAVPLDARPTDPGSKLYFGFGSVF